ncbi:MAG: hypothetical protein LBQ24_05840 [Candidatus Peribacteria bacterium]|nr:hypothetical protein [Candidatus Peribacteria bacterium]
MVAFPNLLEDSFKLQETVKTEELRIVVKVVIDAIQKITKLEEEKKAILAKEWTEGEDRNNAICDLEGQIFDETTKAIKELKTIIEATNPSEAQTIIIELEKYIG